MALINEAAGAGTSRQSEEEIRGLFRSHQLDVDLRLLPGKEIPAAAQEAARRGAALVVAGGGDGTLSCVAGVLAGTSTALGVLPLGTLNHFAKDLGIPLDLPGAVACIASNPRRPIDVGEVNGRIFINNSSIGAYPQVVTERDGQPARRRRPKWLATSLATLHLVRRWPLVHVRIEVNGQAFYRTTPLVFVGNNAYTMHLFSIRQRARLNDGILCLYTAHCPTFGSFLHLVWLSLLNRLDQARNFDSFTCTDVSVVSSRHRLRVARDGEVAHFHSPLRYRTRPAALQVIAPPHQTT